MFLLSPTHDDMLAKLKYLDQGSLEARITEIFASVSVQETLCHDGQDFVRRCLQVEPELRMTAPQAKRHSWLRISRRKTDEWSEIRTASWKPTRRSRTVITDLPDMQDSLANEKEPSHPTSSGPKKTKKRKTNASQLDSDKDTEESKYFQHPAQGPSKKVKTDATDKTG